MEKRHRDAIQRKSFQFHESLEAEKVARHLYSSKLLSHDEFQSILHTTMRHKQVDILLDLIVRKGENAFKLFTDALYAVQSDLGALLMRELHHDNSIERQIRSPKVEVRSIKEQEANIGAIRRELQEEKASKSKLECQVKELTANLGAIGRDLKEEKESKTKLEYQIQELTANLGAIRGELQEVKASKPEFEKIFQDLSRNLDDIKRELHEEKASKLELERQIQEHKEELQQYKEKVSAFMKNFVQFVKGARKSVEIYPVGFENQIQGNEDAHPDYDNRGEVDTEDEQERKEQEEKDENVADGQNFETEMAVNEDDRPIDKDENNNEEDEDKVTEEQFEKNKKDKNSRKPVISPRSKSAVHLHWRP